MQRRRALPSSLLLAVVLGACHSATPSLSDADVASLTFALKLASTLRMRAAPPQLIGSARSLTQALGLWNPEHP